MKRNTTGTRLPTDLQDHHLKVNTQPTPKGKAWVSQCDTSKDTLNSRQILMTYAQYVHYCMVLKKEPMTREEWNALNRINE